jgi:UDP-2-acetamido-3-amino-2,3-dideoxy-glucuronate N-acetyltransferase
MNNKVGVHHSSSDIQSLNIGTGTNIWQYCIVLPGAHIGRDCNICAHVFIENDVVIGDRVTIKSGVQLWDGLRISDDVFIGPNASFSNDLYPKSKLPPPKFLETKIGHGSSIGANATILPGIKIGSNALIGAGSVVTHDVPDNAIVYGVPAMIKGYSNAIREEISESDIATKTEVSKIKSLNGGGHLYFLSDIKDLRGSLSLVEYQSSLPFIVKRAFWIYDVPSSEIRGEHAHKKCHQFLVCVKGEVTVITDNRIDRSEIRLDRPTLGLHIPPMIWAAQYKYSSDAVLMVYASDEYDPDDYIRSYTEFKKYLM